MIFIDSLDDCCCGDRNTWNTFQNQKWIFYWVNMKWTWNKIEQRIALNKALNGNRTVNWIIIKQLLTGNKHINKHQINHECHLKEVEMRLSNTCMELNILMIMEQTITALFAQVLKVWHLMCQWEPFASQASWIVHKSPCWTQMPNF